MLIKTTSSMSEHYPYASLTSAQLPLLKVAALYFDKLVILDPVGGSWDAVGADRGARDAVRLLKEAGILEIVTPSTVLAKPRRPGECDAVDTACSGGGEEDDRPVDLGMP